MIKFIKNIIKYPLLAIQSVFALILFVLVFIAMAYAAAYSACTNNYKLHCKWVNNKLPFEDYLEELFNSLWNKDNWSFKSKKS